MRTTPAIGLALVFLLFSAPTASAGDFGVGLIIGSPTGVSGKLYLDDSHAVDFAAGAALAGPSGPHIHADYLWHPALLSQESNFDLALYFGVGARAMSENRKDGSDVMRIGVRGPVGIVFDFSKARVPLDVFAEVAPVLDLVPDPPGDDNNLQLAVNAGIGVRYYF